MQQPVVAAVLFALGLESVEHRHALWQTVKLRHSVDGFRILASVSSSDVHTQKASSVIMKETPPFDTMSPPSFVRNDAYHFLRRISGAKYSASVTCY